MAKNNEDLAWSFGERHSNNKVKCNFCEKMVSGGITRLKAHIAGKTGDVAACKRASTQAQILCRQLLEVNAKKKKIRTEAEEHAIGHIMADCLESEREGQYVENVPSSSKEDPDEIEEDRDLQRAMRISHREHEMKGQSGAGGASGSGTARGSSRQKFGLMGRWNSIKNAFRGGERARTERYGVNPDTVGAGDPMWDRPTSLKQGKINQVDKETAKQLVGTAVTKFFADSNRPLTEILNPYFKSVCFASATAGPNINFPSPYEISTTFISREIQRIQEWVNNFKSSWEDTGVTLMSDGWKSDDNRSIVNFLIYNQCGTMYHKSYYTSGRVNDGDFLCSLMVSVCEEIRPENVVQIVMDNEAGYKSGGRNVGNTYQWILWTPCAAHCIDFILKYFTNVREFGNLIDWCKDVTTFIYNHVRILEVMRKYTKRRELLRPAVTRFATVFLTM